MLKDNVKQGELRETQNKELVPSITTGYRPVTVLTTDYKILTTTLQIVNEVKNGWVPRLIVLDAI